VVKEMPVETVLVLTLILVVVVGVLEVLEVLLQLPLGLLEVLEEWVLPIQFLVLLPITLEVVGVEEIIFQEEVQKG
jgi:hypothetical protein